jgi:hypothetical protein
MGELGKIRIEWVLKRTVLGFTHVERKVCTRITFHG